MYTAGTHQSTLSSDKLERQVETCSLSYEHTQCVCDKRMGLETTQIMQHSTRNKNSHLEGLVGLVFQGNLERGGENWTK